MKVCLSLLLIGMASGCASTEPINLPTWDLPPAVEAAQEPHALPPLPPITSDGTRALLTRQGLIELERFVVVAEDNTAIAHHNAAALVAQSGAYNSTLEAGRHMVEVAEIREEMLARERHARNADKWFYRGAMLLMGLAWGVSQ